MRIAQINEEIVGQMRLAVTSLVADLNESLRRQDLLAENCKVLEETLLEQQQSTNAEAVKAARGEAKAMRDKVDSLLADQSNLLERHGQKLQSQEENYRMQMEVMETGFIQQMNEMDHRSKDEIIQLQNAFANRLEEANAAIEAVTEDLHAVREADARGTEENQVLRRKVQELLDQVHNLDTEKELLQTTLENESKSYALVKTEMQKRHTEMLVMMKEQETQIEKLKAEKDELDPLIAGFRTDLKRLEASRERAREDAARAIQEAQTHMQHAHQQQEQSVKMAEALKAIKKELAEAQDGMRSQHKINMDMAREAQIERLALLKGLEEASVENAGLRKILKDNGIGVSVRYGEGEAGGPSFYSTFSSSPASIAPHTPGSLNGKDVVATPSDVSADLSVRVMKAELALKESVQAELSAAKAEHEAAARRAREASIPARARSAAPDNDTPQGHAAPPPQAPGAGVHRAVSPEMLPHTQLAGASGGKPPLAGPPSKNVVVSRPPEPAPKGAVAEEEQWGPPREMLRPYNVEAVVTVFVQGAEMHKLGGKSGTYVTSSIGHAVYNTAVQLGSTPEWRESFRFALSSGHKASSLVIKVCDAQSVPPGSVLGSVKVPLERLGRSKTEDAWFPLVDESGVIRHDGGQVMLRMTYMEMSMATRVSYGYLESLGVSDKTKWDGGFFVVDPLTQELRGFADQKAMQSGVWPFGQSVSVLIRTCELAGDALPSALVLSNPSQRIVLRAANQHAAKAWVDAVQRALGVLPPKPPSPQLLPSNPPPKTTAHANSNTSAPRTAAASTGLFLYASIFKAKDIPGGGTGRPPSVQCRVECGPEAVFTRVERETSAPRFDETLTLKLHPEAHSVLIQVLDEGRVVGHARRNLDDIIAQGEVGGWLDLLDHRDMVLQGPGGTASISVHFEVAQANRPVNIQHSAPPPLPALPRVPSAPSPPPQQQQQQPVEPEAPGAWQPSTPASYISPLNPTESSLPKQASTSPVVEPITPKPVSPESSTGSIRGLKAFQQMRAVTPESSSIVSASKQLSRSPSSTSARGSKTSKSFEWAEATQKEIINSSCPDMSGQGAVWCLVASGNKIFAGCQDGMVRAFSAVSGELLFEMHGHSDLVLALAVQGARIFTGSGDTTIREWDIESMTCVGVHLGHTQRVGSLVIINGALASGSADDTIRLWDLDKRDPNSHKMECFKVLKEHTDSVLALAVTDGFLLSGSIDRSICVWDPNNNFSLVRKLLGHAGHVLSIIGVPGYSISSSDDGLLCVWDASKWSLADVIREETLEAVSHMAYTGDVLVCARETFLQVYDPKNWSRLRSLPILASAKTGTYLTTDVNHEDEAEVSRQHGGVVCSLTTTMEGSLLTGNFAGVVSRWQ